MLVHSYSVRLVGDESTRVALTAQPLATQTPLWAISGFRDSHVHLLGNARQRHRDALRRISAGVVELRDMGGPALVKWTKRPFGVTSAIRGIASGASSTPHDFALRLRGPLAIARAIRENARAGADFVKIFATGSGLQSRTEAIAPLLTRQELSAACQTALECGLTVIAHCHGGPALEQCVLEGVSHLEHGLFLAHEELELLESAGVDLTLTPLVYARHSAHLWRRMSQLVEDVMSTHIGFSVGTDAQDLDMVAQILLLIGMGMPPESALGATTSSLPTRNCIVFGEDPRSHPRTLLRPVAIATWAHDVTKDLGLARPYR